MNVNLDNSANSLLYFISYLDSKLDTNLKDSRINHKILLRLLDLCEKIADNNVNFIIKDNEELGLSFLLNILQAYYLYFKGDDNFIITEISGKNVFDHIEQVIKLFSSAYGQNIAFASELDKTIVSQTFDNRSSKLIKQSVSFDFNVIRNRKLGIVIFDNCKIKNKSKIIQIIQELDSQNVKVILTTDTPTSNDLLNSIDSSIIVNKIKFK